MANSESGPSAQGPESSFEDLQSIHALNENIANLTTMRIFDKNPEEYSRYSHLLGKIIVIDGNISAGKTSLGTNMVSYLNSIGIPSVFLEEKFNKELLSLFYTGAKSNPNPYTFSLQMDMLRLCQNVYQQAMTLTGRLGGKSHVVITDRTIWGNCVFAALHKSLGNLTEDEYNAYLAALRSEGSYKMDYIVYLDVSPEIAYKRVHHLRKRDAEKTIPLRYLEQLDFAYYGQIYHQFTSGQSNIFVLSNEDFYDAKNVLEIIINNNVTEQVRFTNPKEIKDTTELRAAFEKIHIK